MKNRTLLMIPGPIEFEPEVLNALGAPTTSHVAPDFIDVFGQALEKMRQVWLCPSGQPFILAGSGTLAMDSPAANLIEPGDNALVINTGYFGDRYADLLERYGAEVTSLRAPIGGVVDYQLIEDTLANGSFKLMTFTHVDTSTAVKVDAKQMAELGQKHNVLTILDGVCSVAGEEIRQEEWGIDVVLTASQKAIGVPPGLALMVVSPKAIDCWRNRKTKVGNYYADWSNWLPIMEAYEARKPSYFGTPPVNLICALNVSLSHIIEEGMEKRFSRHETIGKACRTALNALGMKIVPTDESLTANTLSAPIYPEGITAPDLLPKIKAAGAELAGGLHKDIKATYFRIGHMGAVNPGDVLTTIAAIESALNQLGHTFEKGSGLKAAQNIFINYHNQGM
jgi:alanine-glyoxylate transaminase/serine-glyoxylate transaminase/serine-pyruvate transaminase